MNQFNYYGLAIMVVIMVPNIIYAVKNKGGFGGAYDNKAATVFEQIGRYGCFVFMIFNIPFTYMGFYFPCAEVVYIAVNCVLSAAYCIAWIALGNRRGLARALALSIIPSVVFLFSAAMLLSAPLFLFGTIFAVTHILISVKNA